jgi:type II secretory pathway pseudopilin PulG
MAQKFDNHMIFRIVLIVLAAFVLFALINYYNSKQQTNVRNAEKFYQDSQQIQQQQMQQQNMMSSGNGSQKLTPAQANTKNNDLIIKQNIDSVKPSEEQGDSDFRAVDFKSTNLPSDCFPRDRLTADDLLPADAANSKWAQVNPAGQGDVSNQNFLTAGWAVGINTISGSLRNANLQLRSEPPNPRGAWPINNSTISNDLMRRPLEIGGDCGM